MGLGSYIQEDLLTTSRCSEDCTQGSLMESSGAQIKPIRIAYYLQLDEVTRERLRIQSPPEKSCLVDHNLP